MRILVLNTGSSSIKFAVYETDKTVKLLLEGSYASINNKNCSLSFQQEFHGITFLRNMPNQNSMKVILLNLFDLLSELKLSAIDAIGQRVVHGGLQSSTALQINTALIEKLQQLEFYCPLHTPAIIETIKEAQAIWLKVPQVAVFDTSFHQTIPEYATTYAIPKKWRDLGLRKYGFHGLSHQWVSQKILDEFPIKDRPVKIISCHLGSGASMCAIQDGFSIDTSMGASPLGGLVMETRPGDIDSCVVPIVSQLLGLNIQDIYHSLFHDSGLIALAGLSDFAQIESLAKNGNAEAIQALEIYAYRIKTYIGSYIAILGGLDALIFTGGIGENSAFIRTLACEGLSHLGIAVDPLKNDKVKLMSRQTTAIEQSSSKVKIFVVPSNEQAVIAMETNNLLSSNHLAFSSFNSNFLIPVCVSARHIHLSKKDLNSLFGDDYVLEKLHDLNQPNTWAAVDTVSLIGPHGSIEKVRILGPTRDKTQIEISKTDAIHLGIEVPIRISGSLEDTPFVLVKGSNATIRSDGLIIAARHIHTNPEDASRLNLQDGSKVAVSVTSNNRQLIFQDVLVRVSEHFKTEMHIDTDEANAADVSYGISGQLATTEHLGEITS